MATFLAQDGWYYYRTNIAKEYKSSASSSSEDSSDLMTSIGERVGYVSLKIGGHGRQLFT